MTFVQARRHDALTVGNFWPHGPASKAARSVSARSALYRPVGRPQRSRQREQSNGPTIYLYINTHIWKAPMLAIRLPESVEERLNTLASETGRTKTALAREAIVEYIDDLEDYYLAEARARKNRKTIPLADVERKLGL